MSTDLSSEQLPKIEVVVSGSGGRGGVVGYDRTKEGNDGPQSFGVLPADGDLSRSVLLTVRGAPTGARDLSVERTIQGFIDGKSVDIWICLSSLCSGDAAPPECERDPTFKRADQIDPTRAEMPAAWPRCIAAIEPGDGGAGDGARDAGLGDAIIDSDAGDGGPNDGDVGQADAGDAAPDAGSSADACAPPPALPTLVGYVPLTYAADMGLIVADLDKDGQEEVLAADQSGNHVMVIEYDGCAARERVLDAAFKIGGVAIGVELGRPVFYTMSRTELVRHGFDPALPAPFLFGDAVLTSARLDDLLITPNLDTLAATDDVRFYERGIVTGMTSTTALANPPLSAPALLGTTGNGALAFVYADTQGLAIESGGAIMRLFDPMNPVLAADEPIVLSSTVTPGTVAVIGTLQTTTLHLRVVAAVDIASFSSTATTLEVSNPAREPTAIVIGNDARVIDVHDGRLTSCQLTVTPAVGCTLFPAFLTGADRRFTPLTAFVTDDGYPDVSFVEIPASDPQQSRIQFREGRDLFKEAAPPVSLGGPITATGAIASTLFGPAPAYALFVPIRMGVMNALAVIVWAKPPSARADTLLWRQFRHDAQRTGRL